MALPCQVMYWTVDGMNYRVCVRGSRVGTGGGGVKVRERRYRSRERQKQKETENI